MKVCTNPECGKAGEPQPLENFNCDARRVDGRRSHCRACQAVRRAAHYAANRDKERAAAAAYANTFHGMITRDRARRRRELARLDALVAERFGPADAAADERFLRVFATAFRPSGLPFLPELDAATEERFARGFTELLQPTAQRSCSL